METWSSSDSAYVQTQIELNEQGEGIYRFVPGMPEFGCPFTKSLFYNYITVDEDISDIEINDQPNFSSTFEAKAIIEGQAQAFDQKCTLPVLNTSLP